MASPRKGTFMEDEKIVLKKDGRHKSAIRNRSNEAQNHIMPQDLANAARTSRSRSPVEAHKRSVSQINKPFYPATAFKSQYLPSDRENYIDLKNNKGKVNPKRMER